MISGSCLNTVLSDPINVDLFPISIWFNPSILISTGSSIVVIFISEEFK